MINFDYNSSKDKRGPIKCRSKEYETPKFIIFYGGSAHVRRYTEFINTHFNTTPDLKIINEDRYNPCIKFDEEFDFFED